MKNKIILTLLSVLTCAIFLMPAAFAFDIPEGGITYEVCLGAQSITQGESYTERVKLEQGTDVGFYQNFGCNIRTAQYKVTLQRNAFLFQIWDDVATTNFLNLDSGYCRIWRNVNNKSLNSFRYKLKAQNNNDVSGAQHPVTGHIHMICGWMSIDDQYNYVTTRRSVEDHH